MIKIDPPPNKLYTPILKIKSTHPLGLGFFQYPYPYDNTY